jgi:dTDP-4-dehydrorhamnose reductase
MQSRKRVLVTGCKGQLATDLLRILDHSYELAGADHGDLDITDARKVRDYLEALRPQIVLHTAALTKVDYCEKNPDQAFVVNAEGTKNVAQACNRVSAHMLYFSTDYVFDGTKNAPYTEEDTPNPLSVYGRSKFAGETFASELLKDLCIVRVSWLYGGSGENFVAKLVESGRDQLAVAASGGEVTPLRVVADRYGCPTWTEDVARQVRLVLENNMTGVVHAAAHGRVSRFDEARRIFGVLDMDVDLRPCSSDEYTEEAVRPASSVLDNARLRQAGLDIMRPWEAALEEFLTRYLKESTT